MTEDTVSVFKLSAGTQASTFLVMGWYGKLNERVVRVPLLTPYQHIRITWTSRSGSDAIFGNSQIQERKETLNVK